MAGRTLVQPIVTMDATITVRRAQVKDAEAIAWVHVGSWRTSYAGIVNAERWRLMVLAAIVVISGEEKLSC